MSSVAKEDGRAQSIRIYLPGYLLITWPNLIFVSVAYAPDVPPLLPVVFFDSSPIKKTGKFLSRPLLVLRAFFEVRWAGWPTSYSSSTRTSS